METVSYGVNSVALVRLANGRGYYLRSERFDLRGRRVARTWVPIVPMPEYRFRDDARTVFLQQEDGIEHRPFTDDSDDVAVWYPAPGERFGPVETPGIEPIATRVLQYIGTSAL